MTKRYTWILGLLISLLLACEKDDGLPGTELPEPIREIMNNAEGCPCETKIDLLKWRGQSLYLPYTRHPGCNMAEIFYDEEGNKVKLDADDLANFDDEATVIKEIWSCGE